MLLDCMGITLVHYVHFVVIITTKHDQYHSTPPCAFNIRIRR